MWNLRILALVFIGAFGALKAHEATRWSDLQPLREQLAVWMIGDLDIPMGMIENHRSATPTTFTLDAVEALPEPPAPYGSDQGGHASPPPQYRCALLGPPIVLICEHGLPGRRGR